MSTRRATRNTTRNTTCTAARNATQHTTHNASSCDAAADASADVNKKEKKTRNKKITQRMDTTVRPEPEQHTSSNALTEVTPPVLPTIITQPRIIPSISTHARNDSQTSSVYLGYNTSNVASNVASNAASNNTSNNTSNVASNVIFSGSMTSTYANKVSKGWTKPIVLEPEPEPINISHKDLTKADIDEFHSVLATAYQCGMERIDYEFRRISDLGDEDRETHIWLIFYIKEQVIREIFNIKMLLPPELIQMARQITMSSK